MSDEPFSPHNTYFCERHARIALERIREDSAILRSLGYEPTNADGHLKSVIYRLSKDLKFWDKTLGPDWRKKLRRGKYK